MKLVSSNDVNLVEETIHKAITQYWSDKNITKATDAIAKLKGVGPATASLLLSVHDPDRVIFFSDEAFWWLCCGGQKLPIKYTAKEYQQLNAAANKIAKRLDVGATEVEMVAYVVMKGDTSQLMHSTSQTQGKSSTEEPTATDYALPKATGKRKNSTSIDATDTPLRRSQRNKVSWYLSRSYKSDATRTHRGEDDASSWGWK